MNINTIPEEFKFLPQAACLVLIKSTGEIAVCSRRNSDIYGLPGGKVDPGETMAQAAVRETQEEIGVDIKSTEIESIYAAPILGTKSFWVETFIAEVKTETSLKQMESDISVGWTTWDAFLKKNAFQEYNQGVFESYTKWYQNKYNSPGIDF